MGTNVLFLCTGNSCRSQMAEGFLRHYGGSRFNPLSAGIQPAAEIHPIAVEVMAERDINISGQVPKGVEIYLGRALIPYVIVVCAGANESCPRVFPGITKRLYWPFDDPADFNGSPEEIREKFRDVRDEIELAIKEWLAEANRTAGTASERVSRS